jgi:hypothetical protein
LLVSLSLYSIMLALYGYAVWINLDRVTLPELVRTGIALPAADSPARAELIDELARNGYRAAEDRAGVSEGDRLDAAALQRLVDRGEPHLAVYDPVHLRRMARQEFVAGKTYRLGERVLVETGQTLDEDALVELALPQHRRALEDDRIYVQGYSRLWGIDLTFAFVWLNIIALTGILYGVFWDPVRRVIAERRQHIEQQFHAGEQLQEEMEMQRLELAERLREWDRLKQHLADAPADLQPTLIEGLRLLLHSFISETDDAEDYRIINARQHARRLLATLAPGPEEADGEALSEESASGTQSM